MTATGSGGYLVGGRVVRPLLGEVGSGEERAHLEPRSMQVLEALCERPGEVCSKAELIGAVWGETHVTDEVLTHAIWDLRRAFGDKAADPRFIQTIPKRGYRLIAEVEPLAGERKTVRAARRSFMRSALAGLLALGALLVAAYLMWQRESLALPEGPRLVLLTPRAAEGLEHLAEQLGSHLTARLGARPELGYDEDAGCEPAAVAETHCLEVELLPAAGGLEVNARLLEARSRGVVWEMPRQIAAGAGDLAAVAEETTENLTTYFEVLESPDFRPWIAFDKDEVGAIRDFLVGSRYVYRHEVGGRDRMAAAIAADPDFIAPHVWRTPTIAAEADPAALAEHRRALERLDGTGSDFENVMIGWATALLDGSQAEQLRHLRVALEIEPANRPARLVLAGTLMGQGSLEAAWSHFAGLLEQGWDFPGLYSAGGMCALLLGRVADARAALEKALESDPVDPASLALLELLAVYDGDAERRRRYADDLEKRVEEMLPEVFELDRTPFVEVLAAAAEAEGRPAIAVKLREYRG